MDSQDVELYVTHLEDIAEALYKLAVKAETEFAPSCEGCARHYQTLQIDYKARMALQIITGCDEEDAIEHIDNVGNYLTKKAKELESQFINESGGSDDQ